MSAKWGQIKLIRKSFQIRKKYPINSIIPFQFKTRKSNHCEQYFRATTRLIQPQTHRHQTISRLIFIFIAMFINLFYFFSSHFFFFFLLSWCSSFSCVYIMSIYCALFVFCFFFLYFYSLKQASCYDHSRSNINHHQTKLTILRVLYSMPHAKTQNKTFEIYDDKLTHRFVRIPLLSSVSSLFFYSLSLSSLMVGCFALFRFVCRVNIYWFV